MVDSETIENNFDKKVEQLDKDFLDSLKDPKEKTIRQLEEAYKLSLRQTIEEYGKSTDTYLDEQRKTFGGFKESGRLVRKEEKEEEEGALDMSKAYEVKPLDLKLDKKEKSKIKKELSRFRRNIKLKNTFRKYAPTWVMLFYFRLKIFWRSFKLSLENLLFRIQSSTRRDFNVFTEIVGGFFIRSYSWLKKFSSRILSWFKLKILHKTEQPGKEKNEDEKIAAKLLKEK